MALEDIEKLKEKVDKDPNSKLFVPLAEEYRKEGMTDDAIKVLLSGIERQPGYMSARVSLGKIYLEKGMSKEAQTEFENVTRAIPDNLYAHRKLADIYRDTGDKKLAARELRTVLKLNAMDEEALASLQALEGEESEKLQNEEQVVSVVTSVTEGLHAEERPGEGPGPEGTREKDALTEAGPADFSDLADDKEISNVDIEEADSLVSAGNYTGAMNIYRRVLSVNPNDNKVLQRIEELKSLLRLLGKDKEVLIERLNGLQEGITKRRDDFFRSP